MKNLRPSWLIARKLSAGGIAKTTGRTSGRSAVTSAVRHGFTDIVGRQPTAYPIE
jgi:hypothetical protein